MTSYRKLTQAGFTLVELAIVLLIVGLLISGILKGQELIQNSRVTATIQQIKAYEAAVNTFRDSYGGLPGDLNTAAQRVPGCVVAAGCAAGGGNGIIGVAGAAGAASDAIGQERNQFWLHLALSNLITGVVPTQAAPTNVLGWGTTLPQGRISGGFLVGQANAVANGSAGNLNGHYVVLQGDFLQAANASFAVSPDRASQMDLKMDDGLPATGDVIAFGGATCFANIGGTISYTAAANNTSTCSLGTRIMN